MAFNRNLAALAVLFFVLMAADVYIALRMDNTALFVVVNVASCIVGALLGSALGRRAA